MGFTSKMQHTGLKHFKKGIYENTLWARLTFETHSLIWAVTPWNSCVPCIEIMVCWYTQVLWCILTGAYQRTSFLASGRFWHGSWKTKSKLRRNVSLWAKSGQTMAPAWSENISLATREPICAQVIFTGRHSPLCARVCICFQRLAAWVSPKFSAARDVIWTAHGNSIIIAGNTSARATAKPITSKSPHLFPPEYYLTATDMRNSAD